MLSLQFPFIGLLAKKDHAIQTKQAKFRLKFSFLTKHISKIQTKGLITKMKEADNQF